MTRLLALAACLLWLPAAFAVSVGFATLGSPHVIWSYEWREIRFGERLYTRCTYVGTTSAITERPADGRCGWIRFGRGSR